MRGLHKLRVKLFADGADLDGIIRMAQNPLIKGFTTNPTLMRKAGVNDYERFAPMAPNGTLDSARGIREFIVGTGGKNLLPWRTVPMPGEVVRDNSTFGVMKLTLHPDSYDWQFIPVTDGAFSDSGTANCH